MLGNYIIIALRHFRKNKIPNIINVLGLLVGMVSAVVIAKYVGYALTFDNFHQNQQHIFQLGQVETKNGQKGNASPLTYRGVSVASEQALPEIVNYTTFDQGVETLVKVTNEEGKTISYNESRIFGVDSSFLHIFTFEAVLGNEETALSRPHSAVITRSIAEKYFGNKDPIGETITTKVSWGEEQSWTVTCVLKDIPKHSTLQFDILLFNPISNNSLWENPERNQFIQTTTTDSDALAQKISDHLASLSVFQDQQRKISAVLIPLTPGLTSFELMLALIGLFILILSWINFTNLSIAQSLNRLGEVFIKKALGSSNRQLVIQFFFESLFVNGIALLLTVLLLAFSYDYFTALTGNHLLPLFDNSLHINTLFFLTFIIGAIVTSVYPSIFLVSKKIGGLSKVGKTTDKKGQGLRRGLIVTQFAISSVMIVCTFVISSQMDYMMNEDLGFSSTNKLIIKPPKDQQEGKRKRMSAIKGELAKRSWIERVTTSSTIPGQSYRHEMYFLLKGSNKKPLLYINAVDTSFASVYQIKFLAGTDFSHTGSDNTNAHQVIINEASARALGLHPDDAIHRALVDQEGETYEVIGVVENYHKLSLKDNIEPTIFKYNPVRGYITLNLTSDALHSLPDKIAELKEIWQTVYQDEPFEYFFLTDLYEAQYDAENFFRKVFGVFTIISILLACLGLIGLTLFDVSSGKLEVGIRKTFGASSQSILVLFFKKYMLLLFVATLIGVPISYYVMNAWLDEYSFRILLGVKHILIPSLLLFTVALATISVQIIKLSLVNPAKILREE